jgi:hypothetical protein
MEKYKIDLSEKETQLASIRAQILNEAASERKELNQIVRELEASKSNLEKELNMLNQTHNQITAELNEKLHSANLKIANNEESNQNQMEIYSKKIIELENSLKASNEKQEEVTSQMASKYEQEVTNLENQMAQVKQEHEEKLKQKNDAYMELSDKLEMAKQNWNQEKAQIILKKEEEFQKYMQQLEKRFEHDYSTFMKTHKDAIQRTLNEKSTEYAKEKEQLIELYEKKLTDYDTNEHALKRQIKELTDKIAKLKPQQITAEIQVQTSPKVS